jgi:hypothetical protein
MRFKIISLLFVSKSIVFSQPVNAIIYLGSGYFSEPSTPFPFEGPFGDFLESPRTPKYISEDMKINVNASFDLNRNSLKHPAQSSTHSNGVENCNSDVVVSADARALTKLEPDQSESDGESEILEESGGGLGSEAQEVIKCPPIQSRDIVEDLVGESTNTQAMHLEEDLEQPESKDRNTLHSTNHAVEAANPVAGINNEPNSHPTAENLREDSVCQRHDFAERPGSIKLKLTLSKKHLAKSVEDTALIRNDEEASRISTNADVGVVSAPDKGIIFFLVHVTISNLSL